MQRKKMKWKIPKKIFHQSPLIALCSFIFRNFINILFLSFFLSSSKRFLLFNSVFFLLSFYSFFSLCKPAILRSMETLFSYISPKYPIPTNKKGGIHLPDSQLPAHTTAFSSLLWHLNIIFDKDILNQISALKIRISALLSFHSICIISTW